MNLAAAMRAITDGEFLTEAQAESAMGDIMDGTASALHIAATLGALRMRGESVGEIAGFARAMRRRMVPVNAASTRLVDSCGTGGDSAHTGGEKFSTFNVSTAAAFIAAGAGARVAKHGNRAQSSQSGSADALEKLGVKLDFSPPQIARCIDEIGLGFMFAPAHHPAMKNVAPIRRELGIRTVFNLLGPLCNPARAEFQMLGVSDLRWLRPIAEVLRNLGTRSALIAHSEDGLDEFSTSAPTHYIHLKNGELHSDVLHPQELNIAPPIALALRGGDANCNAKIIEAILRGEDGAPADLACLNAAAVLVASENAEDFADGLRQARAAIASGATLEKLERLREYSRELNS